MVSFPLYLYKRRELIEIARETPIENKYFRLQVGVLCLFWLGLLGIFVAFNLMAMKQQ
jgi:hypothetical protein